jgi:hypothetical protein
MKLIVSKVIIPAVIRPSQSEKQGIYMLNPLRPSLRLIATFAATGALLLAAGCGGSSDTPAPTTTPANSGSTSVSGSVVKGPVGGAKVCAYAVADAARGAALGSCIVTTDTGTYTLSVPVASGLIWVESTGGFYTDETTGATVAMPAGAAMKTLLTANGGTLSGMLTPLTTLAMNAAQAAAAKGGTFDSAAFDVAAKALLATLGLPSTLSLNATAPLFGANLNDYGTALTVISRMNASGVTLADILGNFNPATLQASYQAAAAQAGGNAGGTTSIVVSAGNPASLNGTLDAKTAQYESGSSNETMTTFLDADPYCRVAVYVMNNPATNNAYYIEIPFRKDTRSIGLVKFGSDATNSLLLVRTLNPTTGVAIDTANRRITLSNLVISSTTASVTLNGTINYPTNAVAGNRAACG